MILFRNLWNVRYFLLDILDSLCTLKTDSFHDNANFAGKGGTGGCRCDDLRCPRYDKVVVIMMKISVKVNGLPFIRR